MRIIIIVMQLFFSGAALAAGIVEIPAHSYFTQLKVKNNSDAWLAIDIPEINDRSIMLPAGSYQYSISIQSSVSAFKGEFKISDNDRLFVHRAISPDMERVHSWVSKNSPRSEENKKEVLINFCTGIFSQSSDKEKYVLDACDSLYAQDDAVGIHSTGFMHQHGINGKPRSTETAAALYKKAYDLGNVEAGISYVLLKRDTPVAISILKDIAEKGDKWAIGVVGQMLSASSLPEEVELSKKYASMSLSLNEPVGFKIMSNLDFRNGHRDIKHVITAAAYYNLYAMNYLNTDYNNEQYKKAIEEYLTTADLAVIQQETHKLAEEYINSDIYMVVNTKLLERYAGKGKIEIVVNGMFRFPVESFSDAFSLEMMPSTAYKRVGIDINGEYEDQITFTLDRKNSNVHCLVYDDKRSMLKVVSPEEDASCKLNNESDKSMWQVLNQYL